MMENKAQSGSAKKRSAKKWIIIAATLAAALVIVWFAVGQDWLSGVAADKTEQLTQELFYGTSSHSLWTLLCSSAQAEQLPEAANAVESFAVEEGDEGVAPLSVQAPEVSAENSDAPASAQPQGDFMKLYTQNPDTVGWLKAGENIDHPVVQRDNSWYLEHNFFGEKDKNGALFVNTNNQLVPRDDVLLIHGHDMKSGAMFGKLLKFREESYMRQHPLVIFRTVYDAKNVYYVPVAGFDASMLPGKKSYFDITQMAFPDDDPAKVNPNETTTRHSAAYQAYLDSLQEWSYWPSPVDVNVDDELLMLVTCSYLQEDGRFMLVCRKLRADETPERIEALLNQ